MQYRWKFQAGKYFPIYNTQNEYFAIEPTQDGLLKFLNGVGKQAGISWCSDMLLQYGIAQKESLVPQSGEYCELPTGVYGLNTSSQGDFLTPTTIRTDQGVHLGSIQSQVEDDITYFLKNRYLYEKIKACYKRGYLFYGAPGNGKTQLIRRLIHQVSQQYPSIVVFVGGDVLPRNSMRETLLKDSRLKIFVFEELTELEKRGWTQELLTFLDGEGSVDNALIFGTTNYSSELPDNLVERPGRFDRLIRFEDPEETVREAVLRLWGADPTPDEIKATDGLSIAALGEIYRRSLVEEKSFLEIVQEYFDQIEQVRNDFKKSTPSGFSGSTPPSARRR